MVQKKIKTGPKNENLQEGYNRIPSESNDNDEEIKRHTIKVGKALKNRRIDKYLQARFSKFSRAMLQNIIKEGGVSVNAKLVKPSHKLNPGDIIQLSLPEAPKKQILPENIPLNIIYEDESLIIINKQADLIVHPARSNTHGTLVNALVYYAESLSTGSEPFRPGIVHRLDRDTTGVMVVAKNDFAQWKIARQFEQRLVKKSYLAIVQGIPELDADRISAPLGVNPQIREKYAIRTDIGKDAETIYKVLEAFKSFSLLRLTPKTGRTHQIRVHLSYIKHPIVADRMYGGKPVYPRQFKKTEQAIEEPVINRPALHAHTLEFIHPATKKSIKFEAPLPGDMLNLLDMLRKYRK